LLETGRPLLIPGRQPTSDMIGGTVAIAWKATPQAARDHRFNAAALITGLSRRKSAPL
jgi:hypothetical protein